MARMPRLPSSKYLFLALSFQLAYPTAYRHRHFNLGWIRHGLLQPSLLSYVLPVVVPVSVNNIVTQPVAPAKHRDIFHSYLCALPISNPAASPILSRDCTILHSHQHCTRVSLSLLLCQEKLQLGILSYL